MTTPHRTLQMALDALDAITDDVDGTGLNTMPSFDKAIDAITALREALSAPEPEPVMEFKGRRLTPEGTRECWGMLLCKPEQDPARGALLYAAPPAAPEPVAARCPDCIGSERPGWKRGMRCATCDGSATVAAPPAAPAPAASVPDGMVMVPMEPTPEMIAAMPYPANTIPTVAAACYRAMIAAHGITGASK